MATFNKNTIFWDTAGSGSGYNSFRYVSSNGTRHTYARYGPSGTIDATNTISYDESDKKWRDENPSDHPGGFVMSTTLQSNPSNFFSTSPATGTANAEYIHVSNHYGAFWFAFQMAGWSSGSSGSGSGGSSTGYPPPRTTRWLGGVGIAIGWAWNTYQLYGAASGGNPIGGPGGGGWVADFVAGNLVHEATAEIEVGAQNPDGGNVSSGDELYITFDDEHDDVSENPNMTITTEVVDEAGNTVNPSNTVDNTVVAGNTGTTTILKIQCARKPMGKIKVYIKEPDPNNEGIADTFVADTELPRHAKGGNFW